MNTPDSSFGVNGGNFIPPLASPFISDPVTAGVGSSALANGCGTGTSMWEEVSDTQVIEPQPEIGNDQ